MSKRRPPPTDESVRSGRLRQGRPRLPGRATTTRLPCSAGPARGDCGDLSKSIRSRLISSGSSPIHGCPILRRTIRKDMKETTEVRMHRRKGYQRVLSAHGNALEYDLPNWDAIAEAKAQIAGRVKEEEEQYHLHLQDSPETSRGWGPKCWSASGVTRTHCLTSCGTPVASGHERR